MNTKQNVLIVDDEPRNQRIIMEILDGVVRHQSASSGEAALELIEQSVPNLVLLDIMMPGINGYDVCSRIRANPKCTHTKIILLSGKAMIEERLKGYEVGADDYVTKPFAPEELLAKSQVFLRLAATEELLAEMNRSIEDVVIERTKQLSDTQEKLVNTAKMAALGEMAGGIAHEINTPLGTIQLLSDQLLHLVAEAKINKGAIESNVHIIIRTVERISSIIRALKTFSRDGSKDPFSRCSLKQIIDDATSLCSERMKHNSISLEVAPIPDDLTVHCRPVQISQVLLNLISNACDAIALLPEKWIQLSVTITDREVALLVRDSGKGIPETVRTKIFQPFFTTKAVGKGTGLGLTVSKGIMDAHGGNLSIDASSAHTNFILTMPRAT